ncbi:MAG: Asp-tRNA(Asn)/Glu-tRNA(Gln) amidotransferase subunit GatC [Candidatus Omnitrophica bacterium]|nr:Asp-tRNA(Asn)/Glu-tRNA(Gln) amidotransferase subunit GatC [Candidatus Omnitrophota bacterium]
MIDKKTVNYVAGLSRLRLEDAEAERFAKDLEGILQYVDKLNTLDVSSVKPTSHVLDVENVFRDDVVRPSLTNEEALRFAVDKHGGFYKVPKVIE